MASSSKSGGKIPNCVLCSGEISDSRLMYIPPCGHPLHVACLEKIPSANSICPFCSGQLLVPTTLASQNIPTAAIVTRSKTHKASAVETHSAPSASQSEVGDPTSLRPAVDQQENIRRIVCEAVEAQQAVLAVNLSATLTRLIESNIETGFRNLNLAVQANAGGNVTPLNESRTSNNNIHIRTLPDVEQQSLEQLLGLPATRDNGRGNHNSNLSGRITSPTVGDSLRPDKVGHIIHNWKIKFSGDAKGMSVENFIYRVKALTTQTLNGNFDLLCDHISQLFDSKASDWFWRYHQTVHQINWPELCAALLKQYKDSRTDVDFRELIRDRKQKTGETFDSFYEAVVNISDRLTEPLTEKVLVEILRRNLLPDIQHEFLNLKFESVSDLRDSCRRREFFLQDIGRKQTLSKTFTRRSINELDEERVDSRDDEELSAIALVCWNCQQAGHRYHDCLAERHIFCFGCGAANVYKPNCIHCNQKNSKQCAQKSAHRQTQSTSTSSD